MAKKVTSKKAEIKKDYEWTRDLAGVLRQPRITEKATRLAESNVYTFDISPRATARDVKDAVMAFYGVAPMSVNIAKTPRLVERAGNGRSRTTPGVKKAYVTLKKGDRIELI